MAATMESKGGATEAASQDDSFEPYVRLLRVLMPTLCGVVVHDGFANLIWASDQWDLADEPMVVKDTIANALVDAAAFAGIHRTLDADHVVYCFAMRAAISDLLGVVSLVVRPTGIRSEARPLKYVRQLVQPALECLRREMSLRLELGSREEALGGRERDLSLMLDMASQKSATANDADEFDLILKTGLEHMHCALAALWVPDKSIELSLTQSGQPLSADALKRAQQHLMAWMKMQQRTILVNRISKVASEAAAPYKILACPVRHPSGRVIGVLALFNPPSSPDFDAHQQRIAELLAKKATIIIQAQYDQSTGLMTRQAFERQVSALLAAPEAQQPHSILYLDIDRLHVINETFGMHVGDDVIVSVAEAMARTLPRGALSARISGDRLAALIPHVGMDWLRPPSPRKSAAPSPPSCRARDRDHSKCRRPSASRPSADRKTRLPMRSRRRKSPARRRRTAAAIAWKCSRIRTTASSAGTPTSWWSASCATPSPGTVSGWTRSPFAAAGQLWTSALRVADPHARRPRRDHRSGKIPVGGGALSTHADHRPLGRTQCLRSLLGRHRDSFGEDFARFAINLSGQSLQDDAFLDFVTEQIDLQKLPPNVLCFELTETATIGNLTKAQHFMRTLQDVGCQFALDDFGTGVSSLAYLKDLSVNYLKIDGSFVRDALTNTRSDSMIKAIAQLAKVMCMETIAEYVETDDLRVRMADLGVDYGQGFAMGQSQPLDGLLEELAIYEATVSTWQLPEAGAPAARFLPRDDALRLRRHGRRRGAGVVRRNLSPVDLGTGEKVPKRPRPRKRCGGALMQLLSVGEYLRRCPPVSYIHCNQTPTSLVLGATLQSNDTHRYAKLTMLILTRRAGEALRIGDDIEVTVMAVNGNQVRIGIKAPRDVAVDREEIAERKRRDREASTAYK